MFKKKFINKDRYLFPYTEIFPIKNIEKEDVFKKVSPYFEKIKEALDRAFDNASEDRKIYHLENYLIPRRFADNVYQSFCAELSKIEGIKVKHIKRHNWMSVEIDGIRFWIHKLDRKRRVHSQTIKGILRMNQKTDRLDDSEPLIVLGYVANKQNTHYDGFYFIKQEGNHVAWHIDILDEILSNSCYITSPNSKEDNDLAYLRKDYKSHKTSENN